MPLPYPLPRVIAHRGESGLAPENTLSAFELAATNGATWVELDANISADHIPFVHHDDSVERCTNGSGYLTEQTAGDLRALDAGSWFGESFKGEPLPTLEAVIELLERRGLGLNLELKPSAGWAEPVADAVCLQLERSWPANLPLLLSSFSEQALMRARVNMPHTPLGLLVGTIPPDWQSRMESLGCATLHCAADALDHATAKEVKASGAGLLCYTVNDPEMAKRLLDWGVDSVFTDFPSKFTQLL